LEDFEDFDGGEVTFGGSTGKISGKGSIKTKTLNFENVLYVEELQHFSLISVSQICDQTHRERRVVPAGSETKAETKGSGCSLVLFCSLTYSTFSKFKVLVLMLPFLEIFPVLPPNVTSPPSKSSKSSMVVDQEFNHQQKLGLADQQKLYFAVQQKPCLADQEKLGFAVQQKLGLANQQKLVFVDQQKLV
nr:putative ribonuclease H-like domain-containing protein [Tanacetum cinerariifolium]